MIETERGRVWTIGHSIRPIDEFLSLLSAHKIQLLIDIRAFPGSRRYPHFNKENLSATLNEHDIDYKHMAGRGGEAQARC